MSTEFLALDGAVEASGVDSGVAAHYGNPSAEQRALAAGEAIVDLSHHGVITVTGPDRLSWLDSISSQRLKGMAAGDSVETLLLGPTGRIEHAIRALDDGECLWLLVDAGEQQAAYEWLDSMRFMLRVEVTDRSADYAAIGTLGSSTLGSSTLGSPTLEAAAPNGVAVVWHDPWREVAQGGYQYSTATEHPAFAWTYSEIVIERSSLAAASTLPHAGILAIEALRIAAWRPRFSTEVDEKSIPHELDWIRSAVHLTKGCYRGQETVAKVHNLGHPPRRLVMLHLDGSETVLPAEGDEVFLGEKVVGRVTSVARHHELGPIALAVVKRMTEADAVLTIPVGDSIIAAAQEIIVPTSAGAAANVPRLPRLR